MFERIEDVLTLMLSVIAALTTLVGVLEQLLKLWQEVQAEESEVAKQLEKDILRLKQDLEAQGQQIEHLKTQNNNG